MLKDQRGCQRKCLLPQSVETRLVAASERNEAKSSRKKRGVEYVDKVGR